MDQKTSNQYLIKFIKDIGNFKLISLILIALLMSCNNGENKVKNVQLSEKQIDSIELFNEVKKFKLIYSKLPLDSSWKVDFGYKKDNESLINLIKEHQDTTSNLLLRTTYINENRKTTTCFSIEKYIKTFNVGNKNYSLFMTYNLDTLYFYYTDGKIIDINQEVFIKGKYRYLFDYDMLTLGQRKYYLENKDSLDNLKGNNLPKLPELE